MKIAMGFILKRVPVFSALLLIGLGLTSTSCSDDETSRPEQPCDVESDTTEFIYVNLGGDEACTFTDVGFFARSTLVFPVYTTTTIIGTDTLRQTCPDRYCMQISRYYDGVYEQPLFDGPSSYEARIVLRDVEKFDSIYTSMLPFFDTIIMVRNNLYHGEVTVELEPSLDMSVGSFSGWVSYILFSEIQNDDVIIEYDTLSIEGAFRLNLELEWD